MTSFVASANWIPHLRCASCGMTKEEERFVRDDKGGKCAPCGMTEEERALRAEYRQAVRTIAHF